MSLKVSVFPNIKLIHRSQFMSFLFTLASIFKYWKSYQNKLKYLIKKIE